MPGRQETRSECRQSVLRPGEIVQALSVHATNQAPPEMLAPVMADHEQRSNQQRGETNRDTYHRLVHGCLSSVSRDNHLRLPLALLTGECPDIRTAPPPPFAGDELILTGRPKESPLEAGQEFSVLPTRAIRGSASRRRILAWSDEYDCAAANPAWD